MKTLFWIILVLSIVILAESLSLFAKSKEKWGTIKSIKRLLDLKSKKKPQDFILLGIFGMVTSFLGLGGSFLAFLEGNTDALQANVVEGIDFEPKKQGDIVQIYENESFGSTIRPMLTEKSWNPAESGKTPISIITQIDEVDEKVLYVPPSAGLMTFWKTPEDQYNQFAGKYEVEIRIKRGNKTIPREEILLEVLIDDPLTKNVIERQQFAAHKLSSGRFLPIRMGYTLPKDSTMPNIRLRSTGKESLWIEKITIRPIQITSTPDDVPDSFPDVPDLSASGGSARMASPKTHLPGVMAFGPYDASLPAGNYIADFLIKTKGNLPKEPKVPLGKVQTAVLTPNTPQQSIETETLTPENVNNKEYSHISVPLSIKKGQRAEFRVYFFDVAELWFDGVILREKGEEDEIKAEKMS